MITLTNDFHRTTVKIRAMPGMELSPAQIKRARKVLCGQPACACGGPLGERGPQPGKLVVEQIDPDRVWVFEAYADAADVLCSAGYSPNVVLDGLDYADSHGWSGEDERGALALARILYDDAELARTPKAPWAPCRYR